MQRFVEFLEKDIQHWEEAADFCEKYVQSVEASDGSGARSGAEEAKKYRARTAELRQLLDQLREEPGAPV